MQLENYDARPGRRVRLTDSERDKILGVYQSGSKKHVALSLMSQCGCRCQEAVDVRPIDVIEGDETSRTFLRISEGKGKKERQTPMPEGLAGSINAIAHSINPTDSVLGVTTRTARRWVKRAAETCAAESNDGRWQYVGPHDLRRTWGHLALEAEVLPSVLMQWGGWEDYETFQKHYLGKHSESVQAREAEKIGWL